MPFLYRILFVQDIICNKIRLQWCMIYSEWPDFPEYVMHILYLKYSGPPKNVKRDTLGNSLPVGAAQQTTENTKKHFRGVRNRGICYAYSFASKCPGLFQQMMSNTMVWPAPHAGET